MAARKSSLRRICFVTGTRAEYGLMQSVMKAIEAQPALQLQIVATGMHLDPDHGRSLDAIRKDRKVDAIVPWEPAGENRVELACQTARASAELARTCQKLNSDIVMVVGDRVEAFAAASAAHLSGRILAHVHGGDRALGQVDDTLRHAITKLAHLHFPATRESAHRIERLGEDRWRIHEVGSPAVDGIEQEAWPRDQYLPVLQDAQRFTSLKLDRLGHFAVVVLHPTEPDAASALQAQTLWQSVRRIPFEHTVIIYPNNDPGAGGIVKTWEARAREPGVILLRNAPRGMFLGLLRDAAVLIGNSSSGIIEAGSFGTPVIDLGPRQLGRERGNNVMHARWNADEISAALDSVWAGGWPRRFRPRNLYGEGHAGTSIATVLAEVPLGAPTTPKLIAY